MHRKNLTLWVLALSTASLFGQSPDTLTTQNLREVNIKVARENIAKLPATDNGFLWSGKKSEVINLQNVDANISEKTPRQIFSKIPGIFVYDMDGSGNQTNISTRGLDPHRGWEFNIRTDGVINNSDMYGYPASHFSLPFEAVGRIELVRGTGALQYGAQFGGMLNYVLKQPDSTRAATFESINAVGSYGLVSSFNALGGKVGKLQYYVFGSKRVSEGYRDNSKSLYDGEGVVLNYLALPNLNFKAEVLRSNYIYQIPGPLTDAMFAANPRQATRSRNYFNPEIWIPSFTANWKINPSTQVRWTTSAVLGERRSVMFDRLATIADSINYATHAYNPRQVDIDGFNSYTSEFRLLKGFDLWDKQQTLSFGIQYFNNDLHRQQQGKGTTGSDYDLTIASSGWGRDLHLKSHNVSFSLEQKFQFTKRFSLSPGIRYEMGESKFTGKTAYYDPADLANTIKHNFPLLGVSSEWELGKNSRLYAGWSQAYRPVIFKDIIPANVYEQSDRNLKDAYGYNAEMGWRGKLRNFKWDVSAFALQYNNRLGSLARFDAAIDTFVLFRTNIGDSYTHGLEVFAEYSFSPFDGFYAGVFTSTAFFDARYQGDSLRLNSRENKSIKGNRVESVPELISRNGLNLRYQGVSLSFLYSYTGSSFSDPFNTVTPSANGAVGKVPAYGLFDINASYRIKSLVFRLSCNNAFDKQYFTKRPTFYPGPGIWPSDGRSIVFSVAVKV